MAKCNHVVKWSKMVEIGELADKALEKDQEEELKPEEIEMVNRMLDKILKQMQWVQIVLDGVRYRSRF